MFSLSINETKKIQFYRYKLVALSVTLDISHWMGNCLEVPEPCFSDIRMFRSFLFMLLSNLRRIILSLFFPLFFFNSPLSRPEVVRRKRIQHLLSFVQAIFFQPRTVLDQNLIFGIPTWIAPLFIVTIRWYRGNNRFKKLLIFCYGVRLI